MISKSQTLLCPCGHPDCPGTVPVYWPFGVCMDLLSFEPLEAELYLTVRTTSWDYDGERTDLHDLFSLLWAALLRVRGAASPRLITVLNEFSGIESEIYSRFLFLEQEAPHNSTSLRAQAERLSAESRAIFDLLSEAFGGAVDREPSPPQGSVTWSPEPDWIQAVRRQLRLAEHQDYEVRIRPFPAWTYFGSNKRGVTVAQIGAKAASVLHRAFADFRPTLVEGVDALLYRSSGLVNAPALKAVARVKRLLATIDGAEEPLLIPTDSHLIALGKTGLAAVVVDAGRPQFDDARRDLDERRAREASLLMDDHVCVWSEKLDDGRFEALIRDLISVERGVSRVRQVGATREADDGRDLMVEWQAPPDRGGEAWRGNTDAALWSAREILVQVKVRQRGVGRSDLDGLRDTIEHYDCGGLLVVAFPRITVSLFDHLRKMRHHGQWWVEWWCQPEIEERLRRNPDLAARYPDLVRLIPS